METTGTSSTSKPFTHGHNIGTLQLARINGEEYLGMGWCKVHRYGENEWMGDKWDNPQWIVELSKRFNAALRHSVGCVKDNRNHRGLPCDEAGWVNVESILKYDNIWRDPTYIGWNDPRQLPNTC